MRQTNVVPGVLAGALLLVLVGAGCGIEQGLLNPAFINANSGGVYPLTPGPAARFVFVRIVNETGQPGTFVVTVERTVVRYGEQGTPVIDESGNAAYDSVTETKEVEVGGTAPGNEVGVNFSCRDSSVDRVGLGEDLDDSSSPAMYLAGAGATGTLGVGMSAATVPPLSREAGQFNCGDTIIFRAYLSTSSVGGVALESRLLPGSEQPSEFSGPSTFEILEQLAEYELEED